MSQRTAWQLTGYLLIDAADGYRIDTVGLYLCRSQVLATWPVDDYLALLGTCRRDLTELRGVFGELLAGCRGKADTRYAGTKREAERVRQLLEHLAPVAGPGCCPVCTQPLPESARRSRRFCTAWCRDRNTVLRRRGLMPGSLRPLLPAPRKEQGLPDGAEIVSLTPQMSRQAGRG
jgi:hypothetical protein